jgi:hypothetical protein
MRAATARTAGSSASGAHGWLASPSATAWRASIQSTVKNRSAARCHPTVAGRRKLTPHPNHPTLGAHTRTIRPRKWCDRPVGIAEDGTESLDRAEGHVDVVEADEAQGPVPAACDGGNVDAPRPADGRGRADRLDR